MILVVLSGLVSSLASGQDLWEDDPFDFHQSNGVKEEPEEGPEINDPLFSMVLQWAAEDSLGTWTGEDLLAYAHDLGRPSLFPVEQLTSFSRLRPTEEDEARWPGVRIKAVWQIQLVDRLTPPMPYSILGYHPGTLRADQTLRLTETHLGQMSLQNMDGPEVITEIQLFRLDEGTVVLDVDGWLDRLLGSKLDDAAVLGFVAARENGNLIGLAVSLGKDGRHIYGEFDFRRDKVMPNGRATASALSGACRSLFNLGLEDPQTQAWGSPLEK